MIRVHSLEPGRRGLVPFETHRYMEQWVAAKSPGYVRKQKGIIMGERRNGYWVCNQSSIYSYTRPDKRPSFQGGQ